MNLLGPYLAAALLLVGAGVAKALSPADTARALVLAGWPRSAARARVAVRLLAGAEAVVGAAALVHPGPVPAVLVALSYAGFAGFVLWARHRGGPLATCGCFGRADTPATRLHAGLDALLGASAAVVAAAGPSGWLFSVLRPLPWRGIPLLVGAALAAVLAALVLSALGRLQAARAQATEDHAERAASGDRAAPDPGAPFRVRLPLSPRAGGAA